MHGALIGGEAGASVRKETNRRRGLLRDRIAERLKQAQAEGDLRDDADADALSGYLVAILRGIAVEAASGARPSGLRRIADIAMTAWPN